MLTSTLGVVAIGALLLLALGFVNPLVALPVFAIAIVPLTMEGLGKVFEHAAPSANTSDGPGTPTTAAASYEPITDPNDR